MTPLQLLLWLQAGLALSLTTGLLFPSRLPGKIVMELGRRYNQERRCDGSLGSDMSPKFGATLPSGNL